MSPRDAAYSLFGGPLILDVGPSINGEIIRVRVQPINTISVTALGISLLLFASFMCFYLYPLFRRTASERARRANDAEQLGEDEKKTLLSWLHFRSRDRFSTHDGSRSPSPNPSFRMAPSLRRQQSSPSSFARGSLIPHLSPTNTATLTPPPPAYASRPSSPLSLSEFHLPSSPLSALHPRTSPAALPQATLARSGSSSPPTTPPLLVRMGPSIAAQRSVSASTLHPPNMHVPSRARVYSDSEPRSAASVENGAAASAVGHAARNRQSSVGLGISLAARGRQLTRGPSASWNAGVGHGRDGSAF